MSAINCVAVSSKLDEPAAWHAARQYLSAAYTLFEREAGAGKSAATAYAGRDALRC